MVILITRSWHCHLRRSQIASVFALEDEDHALIFIRANSVVGNAADRAGGNDLWLYGEIMKQFALKGSPGNSDGRRVFTIDLIISCFLESVKSTIFMHMTKNPNPDGSDRLSLVWPGEHVPY